MPAASPSFLVRPRVSVQAALAALASLLLHLLLFAALAWRELQFEPQGGRPIVVALAPTTRAATARLPSAALRLPSPAPAGAPRVAHAASAPAPAAARRPRAPTVRTATARRSPPVDPLPERPAVPAPPPTPASPAWGAAGRAAFEWRIERWLAQHRHYPRAAVRAGYEGSARLRFVLARDGALRDAELLASSGHVSLDRAALELLRQAAPFPPLPPESGLDEIELSLPVEYRLRPPERE